MIYFKVIFFAVLYFCSPTVSLGQSPGGINSGLQTWFDANVGTSGTPVIQWNNLGPNVNIPSLTSPNGGNLVLDDSKSNFNNTINTTGAYNGTFHAEVSNRNLLIAGNEVTMYAVYQNSGSPDLVFEFHGSTQTNAASNNAAQWLTWGFRHGGLGSLFANGVAKLYNSSGLAQMSNNANFVGMNGTSNSTGGNSLNGVKESHSNVGSFGTFSNFMELSVGYWPGYGMSRGVMEAVVWDRNLSSADRDKVESYFALKYGITLGVNGTSLDYYSSTNGALIWDVATNAGFNFDIAGVSRMDVAGLQQIKSHSTHGASVGTYTDILTVVNGTSFAAPTGLSVDNSHFIWGHNNQPTQHNGSTILTIPTDNGEIIETIFQREWKSQETGTVGTITLEFDMSSCPGVTGILGSNDLANLRLLVDEDGDYTTGATSISPSSFNNTTNIAYFQHDFAPSTGANLVPLNGFFFTLGSTDAITTPLPITLIDFQVKEEMCSVQIGWSTASEKNSKEFVIEKSDDLLSWKEICRVIAAGNSNSVLDYSCQDEITSGNGNIYYRLNQIDNDGTSTIYDMRSVQLDCEFFKPFLYPNPSQGITFVESPMSGSATITDIKGKVVLNADLNKGTNALDLELISNGVYFVSILLKDNSTEILRLIKD